MEKKTDAKSGMKGLWGMLKESMKKTSEGCSPGCGCHQEEKDKAKGSGAAKDIKKA